MAGFELGQRAAAMLRSGVLAMGTGAAMLIVACSPPAQVASSPTLTFHANISGKLGEYAIDGRRVAASEEVLPRDVVHVRELGMKFRFTVLGLFRDETSTDRSSEVYMPPDMTPIEWPTAAAYDPKRKRIVLVDTGGAGPGAFYLYDPFADAWLSAASFSGRGVFKDPSRQSAGEPDPYVDPVSILFDESSNRFLLTMMSRKNLQIAELSEDLKPLVMHEISLTDLPGIGTLYDVENEGPPAIVLLAADKDFLVLATQDGDRIYTGSEKPLPTPDYVYLFDRTDQTLVVTYKRE